MRTFERIPETELPRMVGKKIHVAGWNPGCTFVLDRIDGRMLDLRTPKTGRKYRVAIEKALYTRMNEPAA